MRLACVQCNSGTNHKHNLAQVIPFIQQAADNGADLVSLPEAVNILSQDKNPDNHFELENDPFVEGIRAFAQRIKKWIHCGSVILRQGNQLLNHSLVIDNEGSIVAGYTKIHLFSLKYKNLDIDESRQFTAGEKLSMANSPWGKIGLSVCYDLRFPVLYRTLCQQGAQMLAVPSAFTRPTGKAHWHSLLRARAIENSCFVFAAAQAGKHQDGRTTYGHSLIVDPWGQVLAEASSEESEVIYADLTAESLTNARKHLSSWSVIEQGYDFNK